MNVPVGSFMCASREIGVTSSSGMWLMVRLLWEARIISYVSASIGDGGSSSPFEPRASSHFLALVARTAFRDAFKACTLRALGARARAAAAAPRSSSPPAAAAICICATPARSAARAHYLVRIRKGALPTANAAVICTCVRPTEGVHALGHCR